MIRAASQAKRSITVAPRFQQMMEEEGFVDVVVTKKKWPTNNWAGVLLRRRCTWPKFERTCGTGRYMHIGQCKSSCCRPQC